jgi:hypothetical protein
MSATKICRHCGEPFALPPPPARTFGRFIDECRECSDSIYRNPDVKVEAREQDPSSKAERYRRAMKRSLTEKGWSPSRIAEFIQNVKDVEPF